VFGGTEGLISLTQDPNPRHIGSQAHTDMIYGDEIINPATAFVLSVLLVVAVATDLKSHRIPNLLLVPALSLALMLHAVNAGMVGLFTAIGGLAAGLAMLLPLYAVGGMAAGDVKLLGVVGSFLGPWGAVVAGLATMMAGAVLGIAIILWHRLWPLLETHAALFSGPHNSSTRPPPVSQTVQTRSKITNIPYAPAVAAGTIAALWYIGFLPGQFLG
jgi:prepilin peptidase CpaA